MNSFSRAVARVGVSIAGLLVGLAVGCNDGEGNSGAASCVTGQTILCACPGDAPGLPTGVQSCNAGGTFDFCQCAPSTSDAGTDTDTGDSQASDSQSSSSSGTEPDLCGNGFEDPGECDNPDGGTMGTCPADCDLGVTSSSGGTTDDSASGSSTGPIVDKCEGVPIYVGNIPAQPSVWDFMGMTGFAAGRANCMATVGADDVCTYAMMQEAEMQGDFAALPPAPGTTFWVHRLTATMFNGMMVQPAATSRCADWTYPTNHINDGEYATAGAGGALTYTLDMAPLEFDPVGLQCNGESRAIPCCNICP